MSITLSQFYYGEVRNVKFNGKTVYKMRYDNNFVYCKPYELTIYTDNCSDPYFLNYSSDEPTTSSDITDDYEDYEHANNVTVFYGDSFSLGCETVDEGYTLPIQSFGPFDKDYDPPSNVEFSPDGTEIIIDLTAIEDSGGEDPGEDPDEDEDIGETLVFNPIDSGRMPGAYFAEFAVIPGGRKNFKLLVTCSQSFSGGVHLSSKRFLNYASNDTQIEEVYDFTYNFQAGENVVNIPLEYYRQAIFKTTSTSNTYHKVGVPTFSILSPTGAVTKMQLSCFDYRADSSLSLILQKNIYQTITSSGSDSINIGGSIQVNTKLWHPWYTAGMKIECTSDQNKTAIALEGMNNTGSYGNSMTPTVYEGYQVFTQNTSTLRYPENDFFSDSEDGIRNLAAIAWNNGEVHRVRYYAWYNNPYGGSLTISGSFKITSYM